MANLNDTATDTKEQIAQLRDQVQSLMNDRVSPALSDAAGQAQDYARKAYDAASDQTEILSEKVRDQPVVALLMAAAAGYLLGRIAR